MALRVCAGRRHGSDIMRLTTMRTRIYRLSGGALWLGLLIILATSAGMVQAHAVLMETAPEDSTRIETPPAEIWVRFNEPVQPVVFRLIDSRGRVIDSGVEQRASTLVLIPRARLPVGGYVIQYRVMSPDGHPVAGILSFGVSADPPSGDQPPVPDAALLALLATAARALQYGGVLVAVGGALFLLWVAGLDRRCCAGAIRPAAAVAVVGGLAGVGLTGAIVKGVSLAGLLTLDVWRTGVTASPGLSAVVLIVGLAMLLAGLSAGWRGLVALGALMAATSLVVTGHAATAPPSVLAAPVVLVHGAAAAFWVGSLWPLIVALRRFPRAVAAGLVARFSRLAVAAVAVLAATGALVSWLQVRGAPDFLSTGYGRLWLVKLGLVALLLGLAALNRWRLTPALDGGAGPLVRSIGAELGLVGLVVVVTAGLGAAVPPRALATAPERFAEPPAPPATGYATLVTVAADSAVIEVEPARVGPNTLVFHRAGAGSATLEATFAGRASLHRVLSGDGPGRFIVSGLELPVPGAWTVSVEAITGAGPVVFRATIPVAP